MRRAIDLDDVIAGIRERDPTRAGAARRIGRAITQAEDGGPGAAELIARIYPATGKARVVGVTGPPGAGKSTLVDRLAHALRESGATVGILAVDPTSPFSGGAILGDRIRMQGLYTDPGCFIRSMATRGAMGGLAAATHDAVDVLDAAGFDWILIETVGVGQDEVDVVRSVETVIVVTLPGLGDDIQAIKAGIMEIADVFVINKADREGVERTERDLQGMLAMADHPAWEPPILQTVASRGEGISAVVEEVRRHRAWLEESGTLEERQQSHLRLRVENILKERVLRTADEVVGLGAAVREGFREREDPYRVADRLFSGVIESGGNET